MHQADRVLGSMPETAQQKVSWNSGKTKIAAVDASGKATFLKPGTVRSPLLRQTKARKAASFKLTYVPDT